MTQRLRIAQVAPIADPVTSGSTGSIEHLVYLLTEELVRRGHEVTLFATGDSRTSARLHAVYPRGYEADGDLWNWEFHETMHVAAAFERAGDFDVIHNHVYHRALPFIRLTPTPVVHSYHVLPDPDVVRLYARYPEAHVIAISDCQGQVFAGVRDRTVVYHGIDLDSFPFTEARGNYLLWLGRIIPDKGLVEAIHIAREVDMPLVVVGPVDDEAYFASQVAPLLKGPGVEYVGPVKPRERNVYLLGAAALLYPILYPEPFGLVLVEAMACGTPVAAVGLGAVPEVVDEGVTGCLAADAAGLAAVVPKAAALPRARVREQAAARFDYRRMVDDYLAVYQRLAQGRRRCAS